MKKYFLIYPIFFALIPIFSLYYKNKELVNLTEMVFPTIVSLILTTLVFFIFYYLNRSLSKSVILTTIFLLLFYFFSQLNDIFTIIFSIFSKNYTGNLDYYLALAFLLLLLPFIYILVSGYKKSFNNWHKYLFFLGLFLIIFPTINTAYYFFSFKDVKIENSDVVMYLSENKKVINEDYPDIYYLVFDGHARADILKDMYDYDNYEFVNFLQDTGFFVADSSSANYLQTYLSMSSALNLSYLDETSQKLGVNSDDRRVLSRLMTDNEVDRVLDKFGYTFVSTPSSWNLKPHSKEDFKMNLDADISDFRKELLDKTPLKIIYKTKSFSEKVKNKVLSIFDLIPKIADIEGPTFNYSHILSPHPPFLFEKTGHIQKNINLQGVDGSHYFLATGSSKEEYKEKYVDQLHYIDQRIKNLVTDIISKYPSDKQPIIIIQSDHGSGMQTDWESLDNTNLKERLSILNAYYVPKNIKDKLYNSITPVNTFRLIFNGLFQMNLDMLEDKSYFSTWEQPFDFIEVSDSL